MDLPVSSLAFHSSLLTIKSNDSVIAHDGFLCGAEIVRTFMLITEGAFQTVLDSYCCVMS